MGKEKAKKDIGQIWWPICVSRITSNGKKVLENKLQGVKKKFTSNSNDLGINLDDHMPVFGRLKQPHNGKKEKFFQIGRTFEGESKHIHQLNQ